MKTKKLLLSAAAVLAIVGSAFAFAPKGTDIFCALTSDSPCNIRAFDKAISPIPTGETGHCLAVSSSNPCPLVQVTDQP